MEWAPAVRNAVRRHVARAVSRLEPTRYSQEPAYVAALLARLDGVVYQGRYGRVEIQSTIVADHGPNPAEFVWGCDVALVAFLRDPHERVEKAVLAQAKKASIPELTGKERERFLGQCEKMNSATNSILGLEVPRQLGDDVLVREIIVEEPKVRRLIIEGKRLPLPTTHIGGPQPLADYLVHRLLQCEQGDRNPDFVGNVADSKLSHLIIKGESVAQPPAAPRRGKPRA